MFYTNRAVLQQVAVWEYNLHDDNDDDDDCNGRVVEVIVCMVFGINRRGISSFCAPAHPLYTIVSFYINR